MSPYKALPRNARVCVVIEPLWALFGPLVMYYAPLYQKSRGLGPEDMGVINSAALAASFIFFALASPITNRLGRRWTSLIFDVLSWSLPMLLWAFSDSFAWFLVAAILNSLVRIVIVSWNMLITEDAEPEHRATVHGLMHLISSLGGLATFAGGYLIAKHGIIASMPPIYIAGSISMTAMFIIRHFTTRETSIGKQLMSASLQHPFLSEVAGQFQIVKVALKRPRFLLGLASFVIANSIYTMDYYRVLYLGEQKGLDDFAIAVVPAFGAILSLLLFFIVFPAIKRKIEHDASVNSPNTGSGEYRNNGQALGLVAAFGALAQLAYIGAPRTSPLIIIISAALSQASFIAFMTFRDATFMNGMSNLERSGFYALVQTLTFFISIPSGWFSGWLYKSNPSFPFVFSIGLYMLGFMLSRMMRQTREPAQDGST